MPVAEDFQCLICHCTVKDCRSTSCCGALTCGPCVEGRGITSCPQCRNNDLSFLENKPMQRIADNLEIPCANCRHSYRPSENHDTWCPEKDIVCFFTFLGCKWKGPRKSIEEHQADKHMLKCPNDHNLKRIVVECSGWTCDVCRQQVVVGGCSFYCFECDYDECPGCFCHRPIRHLAPDSIVGREPDDTDSDS